MREATTIPGFGGGKVNTAASIVAVLKLPSSRLSALVLGDVVFCVCGCCTRMR